MSNFSVQFELFYTLKVLIFRVFFELKVPFLKTLVYKVGIKASEENSKFQNSPIKKHRVWVDIQALKNTNLQSNSSFKKLQNFKFTKVTS